MNNDPDARLDSLFAQARARRADTSAAEYAFETRLMARLRAERPAASVWAMVSWRMIPFFAICLVALVIWQGQIITETNESEQVAYFDNSQPLDSEISLDL